MAEVPQHLRQRLAEVIYELRNAIGREAAKTYLTRISNGESVEVESGADGSWMEFINEDCVTKASTPSYPTPSSPAMEVEEPPLKTAQSGIDADWYCSASSPRLVSPEHCGKSRTPLKGERFERETLEAVVHCLPRSNLLECLETYWETLKVEGIFAMPSREVFTWDMKGSPEQVRRLRHHLILRHLDVDHDLHQWRRSIAEMRNLDGYTSFLAEAQAEQKSHRQIRQRGESNINKAHKEYIAYLYADRTPRDHKRAKEGLKKDLRHGRRWSILVNGFIADDGKTISGLGLGLLLLCGPATAKKMSYKHQCQEDLLIRVPDIIPLDTTILI